MSQLLSKVTVTSCSFYINLSDDTIINVLLIPTVKSLKIVQCLIKLAYKAYEKSVPIFLGHPYCQVKLILFETD